MKTRASLSLLCATFVCWMACASGLAQTSGVQTSAVFTSAPQPLIVQRVDNSQLVTLYGNTHPLAQTLTDLGTAAPSLSMQRMLLLLKRSPAQQTALAQLLEEQQEKDSPSYHHWLTPAEFGQQFGASAQDIQTVTAWLQSEGFQVTQVSQGRTVIEFSGTAAQVQAAFHTTMHSYLAKDGPHWANATDPSIPAALAPAVVGIESLNNFPKKAANAFAGVYSQSTHTLVSGPQFTQACGQDTNGNPLTCFAVSPWDFATIYNVVPLWNATPAIDGTGQTIAVVGRSNIQTSDISTFRSLFDLPPADSSHLQVILNGPDPGLTDDESEADIDVQWSGAVAKNVKIDFVVSQSTETTDGVDLSALYVIDNNLAPIMSESFGQCESALGTNGNSFFQELWRQAAAQGISVFLSTGDSGAAGCDNNLGTTPQPALGGLAVSGLASTPYNVAVGGTDFNDAANPLTYWNASNDSTTQASAKGYIPETTWNNSCTNSLFATVGFSANAETNCNNSQLAGFVQTVGAGGGASTLYSKPSWQTGSGVPSDGHRDLPDVSLFASNGFVGNFYVICQADFTNGLCTLNNLAGFGGTSVSTPAFAGIMALANQQMGITTGNANFRQGNPNYVLYKLAASNPSAFHDVPAGSTIAMPCANGTSNCAVNTPGHTYGVLSGYATTTGYDLATGLGSVDANALVTNWSSVTFSASATTLSAPSPTSITHGQGVTATITVAAVPPATGTPTGDVSLLTSSGQSAGRFTLSGGTVTATTNTIRGGAQTLIAHYEGDGTFGGSDSAASSTITVTPEGSKTAVVLEAFDPQTGSQTNPNVTTATYGQSLYLLRTAVTNSAGTACAPVPLGQSACPSGNVTITDNGNPLDGGTFTLNSLGYTEDQNINVTGGTHNIQAQYAGDSSFNTSSNTDAYTIAKAPTSFTTFSIPATTSVGAAVTFNATISSASFGAEPSGNITFSSDGVAISAGGGFSGSSGAATGTATYSQSIQTSFSSTGTHTITAAYTGDGNYSSANSSSATITVGNPVPFVNISTPPPTISPGQNVTITVLVQSPVSGGPAITGTVTLVDSKTSATIPATVALTSGNNGGNNPYLSADLTFTPLASEVLKAVYSGDSNYSGSSSQQTISITVKFPTPTLTVTPATVQSGSPATITALVSATVPGPVMTGTVTFKDSSNSSTLPGTVSLTPSTDSNGHPTLQASLTFTPSVNQTFFAAYSGDSSYPASQSSTATITVNGNDFDLSIPATLVVTRGSAAQTLVTVGGQTAYSGTIAFTSASCAGLPSEASCSFSPASVTGPGTTALSITATRPVAGARRQASASYGLNGSQWWALSGGGLFSCVLLLGVPRKRRWGGLLSVIFFAVLMMSVSCGGGSTGSGSGGGGGGGGITDPGTPTGTYTVTVNATDGTHTHSTTFSLTVQ